MKNYRYYEFVLVAFVAVLLCSNFIGPARMAQLELPVVGAVTFGADVLFFPISSYVIINTLKRLENEDYYDRGTAFTPFSLKV